MNTNTPPRNLPRFLPTLTEVVHPSSLLKATPSTQPDLEATVSLVMERVDRVIERRIRDEAEALIRSRMAEQLQLISAGLREELESVVRHALSEVLAPGPSLPNPDQ